MRKPHAEYDDLWETPIGEHPPFSILSFATAVEGSQTLPQAGPAGDAATGVLGALDRPLAA
jgi:hypothetical protein